ncbi:hypothetical protein [Sporosarcina sp. G11-34]|uniref:hypothetical protein n=1 Tax=Sporosarcina sp. G11-34 TaxID=2849605 RepID=UPI0022A8DA69|nr:hypothetical protein [Sporosarcina sp. G11-34]MCZ2257468.1 hypothetical protein [Sporosarcina sp. G11-34]
MYGTVTEYMGTAYTGRGVIHKYDELIASASKTIYLKCPPTNAISDLLNETGAHFIKRGFDIDRFMSPIHPDRTDAVFVKGPDIFFVQASHPVALEPADIGGKHRVVSFYDIYDEITLREQNGVIVAKLEEAEKSLAKALKSLAEALTIHDEWEVVNINRMKWNLHEKQIASLKNELFGMTSLNKNSTISHRLIGSLTSSGARDFIASITKRIERRILIKGLPGTGKSTLMKALGKEAEERGFDVLYGWCGLDPQGVDLIQIPELSVCLIDATKPHVYDPERPGDEILDLVKMCAESEEAELKISEVSNRYAEKMLDATGYMQAFSQANNSMKIAMDSAIHRKTFDKKSGLLLDI